MSYDPADDEAGVEFSEDLREKQREIKTLEEEIEVLDSVIREYDGKFRGQFERIKQTIDKMLNQDMTLNERIQTLFREQCITITSVITALGSAIGKIINSIFQQLNLLFHLLLLHQLQLLNQLHQLQSQLLNQSQLQSQNQA